MDLPRVLVGCPTYSGMEYCLNDFVESVRNLSYGDYEVLFVDNSSEEGYFKKLNGFGIRTVRDDFQGKAMDKIVHSRNLILEFAVREGFDFVLMMDQDVIPQRDVIEKLLSCEKDIVSGVYYNYFASSGVVKWLPVAWMEIDDDVFRELKSKGALPENIRIEDLRRHLTQSEVDSGEVFEVLQHAGGCVLISRKVFEKVKYEVVDLGAAGFGGMSSDDVGFRKNAVREGFKVYCNTAVVCKHLVEGKFERDSSGSFVHPAYK